MLSMTEVTQQDCSVAGLFPALPLRGVGSSLQTRPRPPTPGSRRGRRVSLHFPGSCLASEVLLPHSCC